MDFADEQHVLIQSSISICIILSETKSKASGSNALPATNLRNPFIIPQSVITFAVMNFKDDLQVRWFALEGKLMERFGKKPDVESILFLIGIQELGDIKEKFTKEQKQDLMHIAICTVLAPSGYYELERVDEDGWPHFKQLKPMPELAAFEQEAFLKDHILLYFQERNL
jgi:hypothetical protein